MLKKFIYFNSLIYSYHVTMRTCMLHLSSVVVVGFFFNHNILFYYVYVFHTSQHMCDIACVPIGKMQICIYSMYPSCFLLVFCMVQLLCIGLSKSSTFKTRKLCQYHAVSYLMLWLYTIFYFCLFLTECCAIQCLCLPLPSSKHVLFLIYRRQCRIFDELVT